MRLSNLLLCLLFCGFTLTAAAQQEVPSITVKKLTGESVDFAEWVAEQGKLVVISFWATWCSPCKKELDAIADIYPDWQDEFGVEMAAISIDDRRAFAKIGPLVETHAWDYHIFTDENQALMQALNVPAVPHTFVINEAGQIVWSHAGYVSGDEYELEDLLRELASE